MRTQFTLDLINNNRDPRSADVRLGHWHADLDKVKACGKKYGVPVVAIWSDGEWCSHCEIMSAVVQNSIFKAWMAKSGMYFYFGSVYDGQYDAQKGKGTGPTADGKEGYHGTSFYWCQQEQTTNWPYVRLYWQKDGQQIADIKTTGSAVDGEGYGVFTGQSVTKWEYFHLYPDDNANRNSYDINSTYYNGAARYMIYFLIKKCYINAQLIEADANAYKTIADYMATWKTWMPHPFLGYTPSQLITLSFDPNGGQGYIAPITIRVDENTPGPEAGNFDYVDNFTKSNFKTGIWYGNYKFGYDQSKMITSDADTAQLESLLDYIQTNNKKFIVFKHAIGCTICTDFKQNVIYKDKFKDWMTNSGIFFYSDYSGSGWFTGKGCMGMIEQLTTPISYGIPSFLLFKGLEFKGAVASMSPDEMIQKINEKFGE